jgi:DNA mismatch repair protein MutS2
VLLITGPNTGGKTVALKTTAFRARRRRTPHPGRRGLDAAGLPTLFADIGDEQSISASLSTFSAHHEYAAMDRAMQLPALSVRRSGTGTDPPRARVGHRDHRALKSVAPSSSTTHYDAEGVGTATDGVTTAAFARPAPSRRATHA